MKAVSTPTRSLAQRMEALDRANQVRSARARLKGQVKAREVDVREVLRSPSAEFCEMKAYELLLAVPKVGRVKASKWLSRAGLSPSKTVGGMSERQRRELLAVITGR